MPVKFQSGSIITTSQPKATETSRDLGVRRLPFIEQKRSGVQLAPKYNRNVVI